MWFQIKFHLIPTTVFEGWDILPLLWFTNRISNRPSDLPKLPNQEVVGPHKSRLPSLFSLKCLVPLQRGRWCVRDEDTVCLSQTEQLKSHDQGAQLATGIVDEF